MCQALCSLSSVPKGSIKGFALNDHRYIVTRPSNQTFVYLNRCPHMGIPLEWEPNQFIDNDTGLIRCASHGALFMHDTGHCVAGPCGGSSLTAVAHKIEHDTIFLV